MRDNDTPLPALQQHAERLAREARAMRAEDERVDEHEVAVPPRRPTKGRKRQEAEWLVRVKEDLRAENASLSEERLAELAEQKLADVQFQPAALVRAIDEVKPVLVVRPSREVNRDVELAAIYRLGVFIWLRLWLQSHMQGPVEKAKRSLVVAVGLHMGMGFGRPCAWRWRQKFRMADPVLAWQHLYLTDDGPGTDDDASPFYKQLKAIFGRSRKSTKVWAFVNRDLVRQLAGPLTTVRHRNGKVTSRCARVADAFKYLAVDATLAEADIAQHKPVNDDHAFLMRGGWRQRCGFLVYSKLAGGVKLITDRTHGYKWLEIIDLKLQVPLIGVLMPANGSERRYTVRLLEELFKLYPELKRRDVIYLVGDALYDQDETFAFELMTRFGVVGVFPRAGTVSGAYAWADSGGVRSAIAVGRRHSTRLPIGRSLSGAKRTSWPRPASGRGTRTGRSGTGRACAGSARRASRGARRPRRTSSAIRASTRISPTAVSITGDGSGRRCWPTATSSKPGSRTPRTSGSRESRWSARGGPRTSAWSTSRGWSRCRVPPGRSCT